MKHFTWGKRSRQVYSTLNAPLQNMCTKVLLWSPYDFGLLSGHRTAEEQHQLFLDGASQRDGLTRLSTHQSWPSRAVDFRPSIISRCSDQETHLILSLFAGMFFAAAYTEDTEITWGGDWNGNGRLNDGFIDRWHIETKK